MADKDHIILVQLGLPRSRRRVYKKNAKDCFSDNMESILNRFAESPQDAAAGISLNRIKNCHIITSSGLIAKVQNLAILGLKLKFISFEMFPLLFACGFWLHLVLTTNSLFTLLQTILIFYFVLQSAFVKVLVSQPLGFALSAK